MIVVMSLWRNDANRNLRERALHLLSKKSEHHEVAFLWAVGDCEDDTYSQLNKIADEFGRTRTIVVTDVSTDIQGEDSPTRRVRLSVAATYMFRAVGAYFGGADYVCLHESDLLSPQNVLDLLLHTGQGNPCAGWPVINLSGAPQFYDTWAYQHLDGRFFTADEFRPRWPFRVHCFGSVWVAPAWLIAGRTLKSEAIRELCAQWKAEGHPMYCDPGVIIEQPVGLWSPS